MIKIFLTLLLWVFFNAATATAQDLRPLSFTQAVPTLVVGQKQICHLGFAGVDASFDMGETETYQEGKSSVLMPSLPLSQSQELSFGCRFSYFTLAYANLEQAYKLGGSFEEAGETWSHLAFHLETFKAGVTLEILRNLSTLDFGVGHYVLTRQLGRLEGDSLVAGESSANDGNLAFLGFKFFLNTFVAVEYEHQIGLSGELSSLSRLGINFHVRF